jgi:trehalose 6-phosphate phosphatase
MTRAATADPRRLRRPVAATSPSQNECAYFFDIDGTLLEIATSPLRVRIDRDLQHLIEQLYESAGGAVALISGRSIAAIDVLFPGFTFPVAGQHGVERRDAQGRLSRHPFPSRRFDEVRRRLIDVVDRHSGLFLEDKGLSLALHYRQVPELASYAHRVVRGLQKTLGSTYCVQTGKRVVEIKPAGKDKGMAVREFMREPPFKGRTPVFVGDDSTDEFGFATVNRLRGHSVKVGSGPTAASWRIKDVRAVRTWLDGGNVCGQLAERQRLKLARAERQRLRVAR